MRKRIAIACTLLTALLFASEGRALQVGAGISPDDAKQLYNYTLTMDKIQKVATATAALEELGKHHPEMDNAMQSHSIDGTVQTIQHYPEAVAAITRTGLAPHEYVVCLMTVMQAALAVGLKKSGAFTEYPPKLLEVVSRANLDFTEQHWVEIQKLTQNGDSDN
jgi:hypothetical protein